MTSQLFSRSTARWMRVVAALCAGIVLISNALAQPATGAPSSRFLLIFDTSSAMKERVPATQYTVERLFFSMMNGQIYPGDTVGVWAFDRKLRAGDFPLQQWVPHNAALIASGITNFVAHQHYSRSARFDVVMPDVNKLVRTSERLTVTIFCDGEEEITGTPFDDAINHIFKQNERELRKANQAFIVVLRSQFGQYTGYTVNSSAIGVNFPAFPPLPASSPPAPLPNPPLAKVESNPPPVVEMPPLVIIGTNVGTNLIPLNAPAPEMTIPPAPQAKSNPPPVVESPIKPTNLAPPQAAAPLTNAPPPVAASATNVMPSLSPPVAKTQTNAPAPPGENPSSLSRNGALAIGAALLVAAVGLIIFALVRSRKAGRGSLISRAMKKH